MTFRDDWLCQDFDKEWKKWAYFVFSCMFIAAIPLAVLGLAFIFFVAGMQAS